MKDVTATGPTGIEKAESTRASSSALETKGAARTPTCAETHMCSRSTPLADAGKNWFGVGRTVVDIVDGYFAAGLDDGIR